VSIVSIRHKLRLLFVAVGATALEAETDAKRGVTVVRAGQLFSIFAAVVTLSIAGVSWFRDAPERALHIESESWPRVAATITRGARWCSGDHGERRNVNDRSLCADYQYRVGEETFQRVSAPVWRHLGSPFADADNQSVLDRFRPGATLAVRYNPKTHNDSVVTPAGPSMEGWDTSMMWTGFWLSFASWFALTLRFFFRLLKRDSSTSGSRARPFEHAP
jgi:hypothetical protein